MQAFDEGKSSSIWRKDPLKSDSPEEIELAFQLQNSPPNDPIILRQLVEHYALELSLWINVLLYYQDRVSPDSEHYLPLLENTFQYAMAHIDEFHGRASVRNWLFGVSYQLTIDRSLMGKFKRLFGNITASTKRSAGMEEEKLSKINQLPERIRSAIFLRYLFKFEVRDIAEILDLSVPEIHHRLIKGREKLFDLHGPHHMLDEIQADLDGLLDETPGIENEILQHLESCGTCKNFMVETKENVTWLREKLDQQWPETPLNKEELEIRINSLKKEKEKDRVHWHLQIPYKQAAWMLGLSVMFIAMAVIFIRMTPVEREFPTAEPTDEPVVPTAVELPQAINPSQNITRLIDVPQYILPAFSNDGKWAVFAAIQADAVSQMSLLLTIELYNRETNSIKIINENSNEQYIQAVWWDFVPSISADGNWIAYTSMSDNNDIKGEPCKTISEHPCLDIFLYDRRNGLTRQITQGVAGTAANSDSFSPTVSADGHWVAFWSAAGNLVEGIQENCQGGYGNICMYVYLYHIDNGKIEQIPIISWTSGYTDGVDRISLTADGNLVGFTAITPAHVTSFLLDNEKTISSTLGGTQNIIASNISREKWNYSEAIIYNRETEDYEMENYSTERTFGNGNSSSPVLSNDGRYVVFSSTSNNLVPSDGNGFADVFLRDRNTGKISLVSHAPSGRWGNGDSGRTGWSGFYYSLDISADGQYVVYGSLATNLSEIVRTHCAPEGLVCNLLYLYNQDTDQSELINDPPTYDWSYFPQISADGRWISYMQYKTDCASFQALCSDVILYDKQIAWGYNVTKSSVGILQSPWAYQGNLKIPAEIWERNAITFSPNGNFLASAGNDSKVRIWKIIDGFNRNSAPDLSLSVSDKEYYTCVTFSPDSMWLAAGTTTRSLFIWKLPEGKLIYTVEGNTGPIKDLSFDPDGSRLIVSSNQEAEIWQIEKNQMIRVSSFSYGLTSIYGAAISPLGDLIATGRADGSVWLQSIFTGQVIGRLGGNQVAVSDMAFSVDGTLLAARSMEGKINIWHIERNGTETVSVIPMNTVWTDNLFGPILFTPDNRFLISSSFAGGLLFWGVPDGNIYTISSSIPNGRLDSLAISNAGDRFAATSINGEIAIWDKNPVSSSTYFIKTRGDSYDGLESIASAPANDINMLDELSALPDGVRLNLDQAAPILDFPLLVPAHLPENIRFTKARINQDGSVWLEYDASDQGGIQAGLFIYEQFIGNEQPPIMDIGASAAITKIPLITPSGIDISEYVQGDWNRVNTEDSKKTSNSNQWFWNIIVPTQRLRWQQQGIFIAMYYKVDFPAKREKSQLMNSEFVKLDNLLTKSDLTQIASGMQFYNEIMGMITHEKTGEKNSTIASSFLDWEKKFINIILSYSPSVPLESMFIE